MAGLALLAAHPQPPMWAKIGRWSGIKSNQSSETTSHRSKRKRLERVFFSCQHVRQPALALKTFGQKPSTASFLHETL